MGAAGDERVAVHRWTNEGGGGGRAEGRLGSDGRTAIDMTLSVETQDVCGPWAILGACKHERCGFRHKFASAEEQAYIQKVRVRKGRALQEAEKVADGRGVTEPWGLPTTGKRKMRPKAGALSTQIRHADDRPSTNRCVLSAFFRQTELKSSPNGWSTRTGSRDCNLAAASLTWLAAKVTWPRSCTHGTVSAARSSIRRPGPLRLLRRPERGARCAAASKGGGAAARRRPFCPLAAISTVRFDTPWPPDTGMTHLNNRSANLSTRISRPGTDTSSSPARNKCRSSLASTRTSRLERL